MVRTGRSEHSGLLAGQVAAVQLRAAPMALVVAAELEWSQGHSSHFLFEKPYVSDSENGNETITLEAFKLSARHPDHTLHGLNPSLLTRWERSGWE